jgi:hypothetical protein
MSITGPLKCPKWTLRAPYPLSADPASANEELNQKRISPHSSPLPPPSSQPCESKTHQKRRAGFGHRNQRPACEYGIEAGAGEVRVDVVESGSERIAQSCGIGKDRAGQVRVGQVRAEQVRAAQVRVGQVRDEQGRTEQVRVGQVRVGQDRVVQDRVVQDRVGQVRVGQVREVQERAGQVRVGQVRVGQDRVDQVRERLQIVSRIRDAVSKDVSDGIDNRPTYLLIRSRESGAGSE